MKNINVHDFVRVKGVRGIEVVSAIDGENVTTISVGLSEDKDTIIYIASMHNMNDLMYADECTVNMIGPTYQMRDQLVNGTFNKVVYGIDC